MPAATEKQLISIIIPVFNAEPYLEQCLTSIINQTYHNLEIICIDDGSTDKSLAIMQAFAVKDSRIRIIVKSNQGYGATCNRGIDEANGDWIAIVEPDDWIEQGMYADMLDFSRELSCQSDIIKTPYWRIVMPDTPGQAKINCSYKGRIKPSRQPFSIEDAIHLLIHHPSIWSAIYHKKFLEKYDIRFREYPGAGWADNPFLIETLCHASRIAYLDNPYYCYREETPEKTALFAQKNTLLPLARWNEMTDILERLQVTDKGILCAHNRRGFTYLGGILKEVEFFNPELHKEVTHMFTRMDIDLVLSDSEISPSNKLLFAKLLNLPNPHPSIFPYAWSLVKQGCYNLKNVGPVYTWKMSKAHLAKRTARERK